VLERARKSLASPATAIEQSRALKAAFQAYDDIRRPRAQRQVDTSVECGQLYNLSHPNAGDDMQKTVDNLNGRFDWLWNHDLDADVASVVQRFDEIVKQAV
jgi:salicylate hydroxylase